MYKHKKSIAGVIALFLILICSPALSPASDEKFVWPAGKRAAVSLTFDDGRESQPDVGIPLLNRYGVKATFYVLPGAIAPRISAWKDAVNAGHEIGNHSMTHPCTGNYPFIKENALEYYTIERMTDELNNANFAIERMLGVRPLTFAYPCGQTFVGRGQNVHSYVPLIAESYLTGRTYGDTIANKPGFCDLAQVTGINIDGLSFDQIRALVDEAAEKGTWLVLAGHDIGTSIMRQVTQTETLAAFCEYANDPQNKIWVATVTEIAAYIDSHRTLKSHIPSVMPRKRSIGMVFAAGILSYSLAFVVHVKTSPFKSKLILLSGSVILFFGSIWSIRYGYIGIKDLIPIFTVLGYCLGCLSAIVTVHQPTQN